MSRIWAWRARIPLDRLLDRGAGSTADVDGTRCPRRARRPSACAPKPSVPARSSAATPAPGHARRGPSASSAASAALTAAITSDTAYTPPSSAIWITGSWACWE